METGNRKKGIGTSAGRRTNDPFPIPYSPFPW
jgi:hypothetical protein